MVSVLPKKSQVLEDKLLSIKNLKNALDQLEVHIPAAKQTLEAVQAKYENGQKLQKISDEDNKVRSVQISFMHNLFLKKITNFVHKAKVVDILNRCFIIPLLLLVRQRMSESVMCSILVKLFRVIRLHTAVINVSICGF